MQAKSSASSHKSVNSMPAKIAFPSASGGQVGELQSSSRRGIKRATRCPNRGGYRLSSELIPDFAMQFVMSINFGLDGKTTCSFRSRRGFELNFLD